MTGRHRYAPAVFPPGALDERRWYAESGLRFALGQRFRLRTSSEALEEVTGPALRDLEYCFLDPPPAGPVISYSLLDRGEGHDRRRRFALYANDTRVCFAGSVERLLGFLLWDINQRAIQSVTQTHLVLHAAAAERGGVVVVLPAPEEHGKTTTVAGLLQAGFRYLTDEAVALDRETLQVTAYPKPLSIDRGSWAVLADLGDGREWPPGTSWQLPASGISAVSEDGAAPRLFVSPRYERGATTTLRPMSRGRMLMTLTGCSFALAPGTARGTLDLLAELLGEASCYELVIGDLAAAVALVESLLSEGEDSRT